MTDLSSSLLLPKHCYVSSPCAGVQKVHKFGAWTVIWVAAVLFQRKGDFRGHQNPAFHALLSLSRRELIRDCVDQFFRRASMSSAMLAFSNFGL